jgi:hypothetical protein
MSNYTLTATLNGETATLRLTGKDDNDAMLTAIGMILDRGIKSDLWGRGEIVLTDSQGVVVNSMAAK